MARLVTEPGAFAAEQDSRRKSMRDVIARIHRCVAVGELDKAILDELHTCGTAVHECEVLDFKQQLPDSDFEYAKTVRDVVALHNSYGGFLVFGVREIEKDRSFELVGVEENKLHVAKLRDLARSYLGRDLRITPFGMSVGGVHLDGVWVAKRSFGENPVRFVKNGPEEKPGKPCFRKNEIVFRRLESNGVAQAPEDFDFLFSARRPPSLELSAEEIVNEEPLDHNLPDRAFICSRFVGRKTDIGELWKWLADDFSRVRLIAGEGGLGKTSLAYRFSEEMVSRAVKPFERVVWLTAKERQFIAAENAHRETGHTDFHDAESLFRAIASAHGCVDSDFDGQDARQLMKLALDSCATMPSFVVVDDVDSLSPPDQQRALEFGMRTPQGTKMLLTTRVNFSYSPDNVLKLNGLPTDDFTEYVAVLRARYDLAPLKPSKVEHLREVSGGSPLFADSLLRLERRGISLDKAIAQWKGEMGLEARKAALKREIQHLSRPAKRVLFIISYLRRCIYAELTQILDYTEQTLGDALQELSSLFLISLPSIARQSSYTVEPNTGLLVMELAATLDIDHAALVAAAKRARSDAIGLSTQKRSGVVGLAIDQAIALAKTGDSKGALEVIRAAAKKLTNPHVDLLLASGRFNLKLSPPNRDEACQMFERAYQLGQRKLLLFDLWFEAEYGRGSFEAARDVVTKALESQVGDEFRWFERRAQVHVALAYRSRSLISKDSAIREVDLAIDDLRAAKTQSDGAIQRKQVEQLLEQAFTLRRQFVEA